MLSLFHGNFLSESLAADEAKTNVTVEVLIFSGRPNPAWKLEDSKPLETLRQKLKDLPEAFNEGTTNWTKLGFRGFRIHGGEALGLPGEIRIHQGTIKAGQGEAARYLKDSIDLEQSLIRESKRQPFEPAVKEAIEKYEKSRKPEKQP